MLQVGGQTMDNRAETTEPEDPAYAAELPLAEPCGYDYDAFLSYSRADTPVAEGIQKGLHSIGRKLGRLHALRVFRDKTDLAASPSLWAKLTEALDKSRYLVVVLSPNSASSEWVNKEIDYWLAHRGRNNLVLVMADGTLIWDDTHGAFNPDGSTAAPPALAAPDALGTEPIYIDVSHDNPWDIQNPIFRDKLTDIAAPIHGKPKYELASDDLREQQRFRRFRRLAISAMAILTILAVAAASIAFIKQREAQQQRNEAIHQRNDAVALRLATEANAILKRQRGGPDDRALQELTTAVRLAPAAARGGVLSGLQTAMPVQKIIRTSEIPVTVRVTPDGKRIITGGNQSIIHIWDATTGQKTSELAGTPHTSVQVVGLTPDGKRLITGDSLSMTRLWNLDTGTIIRQFEAGADAAMSADGTRVAAIEARPGPDKKPIYRIGVWDVVTGAQIGQFPEQSDSLRDLALSPDGHRIITTGWSTIQIWNADNGQQIGETIAVGDADGKLSAAPAFSPDGSRFVAGLSDHTVRQWDAFTGAPVGAPMIGHTDQVFQVTYSPDGTRIASGGMGDYSVRVWDAETGTPVSTPLVGHLDSIAGLTFTSDGQQIVSTSSDRTIRVWRADADKRLGGPIAAPAADLPKSILTIHVVGLLPGGQLDNVLSPFAVWNLADNRVTNLAGSEAFGKLAITPDGRRVAALRFNKVQVWDLHTGQIISSSEDEASGSVIAISPDGTRVALGRSKLDAERHGGRRISMYDTDTGKHVDREFGGLDGTTSAVRFSPDSRQLVAGNTSGQIQAWDATTGRQVGDSWSGDNNVIHALAFSPNGRLLASGQGKSIWIWDTQTHRAVGEPLTGHTNAIYALAFSPDGRLLASGAHSDTTGEVRIWDVASGQQIGEQLPGTDSQVLDVGFSPDSTGIFASQLESVWRWPGPAQWPDLLCDKLSVNMSRTQWKLWVSPDIDYVAGCPDLPVPE
ncbi:toll/interleukin-1 receptor domain-containing protein [Mycobacteroides salmoniphilum]|nr:TIR domain-containing protein [Mycobacteroides salmoniphilum]